MGITKAKVLKTFWIIQGYQNAIETSDRKLEKILKVVAPDVAMDQDLPILVHNADVHHS